MNNEKKLWFKRKTYGWGWTPSTWQGWLVTLIYTLIVLTLVLALGTEPTLDTVWKVFIVPLILATLLFIEIAYWKGDKPKWQWGKKTDGQK